jgi:hypothetical protein
VTHAKAGGLPLFDNYIVNFISADLEYLTNAYMFEMFMANAKKGPSSTWSMTTVAELEDMAMEKYRTKAEERVSVFKGHAKPMYDPSQNR